MDSETIERIAADWLAKRDGDSWTQDDERAFLVWQRESTLHRVAVIRLRSIWQHADRLQALGAGVPAGSIPPPHQWRFSAFCEPHTEPSVAAAPRAALADHKPRARKRLPRYAAQVAALLVIATAGILWSLVVADSNTYHTAIGDIKALHLTDGSKVTLNTDSTLRVIITSSARRLQLDRGEAFFDVAKDPARPFVVYAGDKRVLAVGTKFSVRRERDDIKVVVAEGKVAVSLETAKHGNATLPNTGTVMLAAGDIARTGGAGVLVTEKPLPEVEQALSWRSGYIMLRNATLADAINEFNRYNKRQLVLGDPSLADLHIGGNLRLTNVDAFVRILEQGFPIRAQFEGERISLNRK